jgi:hypothetical protein
MKTTTLRVSTAASRAIVSLVVVCLLLPGCGGTKVLKNPPPMPEATTTATQPPLANGGDDKLEVRLNWVIVRDGPGTWARNADWDEYLLVAHNSSGAALRITGVSVYDSLGNRVAAEDDRKRLVEASRKTSRLYKDNGVEVMQGAAPGTMLLAGAAGYGIGAAVGSTAVVASSALAVGALAALALAPVLVVGGVVKAGNNHEVAKEIQRRHTDLPVDIDAGNQVALDLFFPLAPSPRRVEVTYLDAQSEHTIVVDTRESLEGLHIRAGKDAIDSAG